MKITYLGHAGFAVETQASIIICDPWLSPYGAFDSAWFQLPKNHHLADQVYRLLERTDKDKYIYISHEHQDHFDLHFLNSIPNRDFTFVLAKFFHPRVETVLKKINYQCNNIVMLGDEESLLLKDGRIVLFVNDAELECDSAILIEADSTAFLNLNDCKLHERLSYINKKYQHIAAFASQYSGAIWHPTCYEMPLAEYQEISKTKRLVKFNLTLRAIEELKPSIYFASAGPPCFLDPMLLEKNFEAINIFPRAHEFISYLNHHCKEKSTLWPEVMPGDTFDVNTLQFSHLSDIRFEDNTFESYVRDYHQQYQAYFKQREIDNNTVDAKQVFLDLEANLKAKLNEIKLINENMNMPLYWQIADYPEAMYCINFADKTIKTTTAIENPAHFYRIAAPAWQVNKVLSGEITWPDFVLTFRVNLMRKPNIYHNLIFGFLSLDSENIARFCELSAVFIGSKERIIVNDEGKRYSILRYCPHQGGDLAAGYIDNGRLVCPRHGWKFDLTNQGKCIYNDESINAVCLNDIEKDEIT